MTLSIRPTHSPLSLEAVLKETNLGFYPRAILNIREPVEEKKKISDSPCCENPSEFLFPEVSIATPLEKMNPWPWAGVGETHSRMGGQRGRLTARTLLFCTEIRGGETRLEWQWRPAVAPQPSGSCPHGAGVRNDGPGARWPPGQPPGAAAVFLPLEHGPEDS